MDGAKSLFASKTFWGAAVAIVAGLLSGGNYALAVGDQAQLTDLLVAIGSVVGGIGAIVGRIRARARIGKVIDAKPELFGVSIVLALLLGACATTMPGIEVERGADEYNVPGGFSVYEWEPVYAADGKFVGFGGRVYTGREVDDLEITTTRDADGLPTVSLKVKKLSGIEAQQAGLAAMAGVLDRMAAMLDKLLAMAASGGAAGLPLPIGPVPVLPAPPNP